MDRQCAWVGRGGGGWKEPGHREEGHRGAPPEAALLRPQAAPAKGAQTQTGPPVGICNVPAHTRQSSRKKHTKQKKIPKV